MRNVVLSGIFYPMAMLRYFENALRKRDDIRLYAAGPWTASWIPWRGGMHVNSEWSACGWPPDYPLPKTMIGAQVPIEAVARMLPWKPDLWIQVDAGWHLVGRPVDGKNVIIGTDPHVLNYGRARSYADVFYCMQRVYAEEGDRYLPYAFDPVWHRPVDVPREHDACLIGLQYDHRSRLIDDLRARGKRVYYETGPVWEEYRNIACSAPIGLNWSSKDDLVARVFELLAMERLTITNGVTDQGEFFENGRHLIVFESREDAVEKVLYFLDHPGEASGIAKAGRLAVQDHTWDDRIQQILEEVT